MIEMRHLLKVGDSFVQLVGLEARWIDTAREELETLAVDARGQTHTSITMVDVIVTGAPYRAEMSDAIAHATITFAQSTALVNGVKGKGNFKSPDLGPDGGKGGGSLLAEGPPERIVECDESHTGKALAEALKR